MRVFFLSEEEGAEVVLFDLGAVFVDDEAREFDARRVDVDLLLDLLGVTLDLEEPPEDAGVLRLVGEFDGELLVRVDGEGLGIYDEVLRLGVFDENFRDILALIFEVDLFRFFLAHLDEAEVDEGFEDQARYRWVGVQWDVLFESVIAHNLDTIMEASLLDDGGLEGNDEFHGEPKVERERHRKN